MIAELAVLTFIILARPTLTLASTASVRFVQLTASATTSSSNSLALSFPSKTSTGDSILVAFDYRASATPSTVTDSQGNTFAAVGYAVTSPGGAHASVYAAKNVKGGADTVTVTLSSASSIDLYLAEYSGVATVNTVDAWAGAAGKAGAVSSGNATTTAAGDLIFGYAICQSYCTAGSGFATRSTLYTNLIEDTVAGASGNYAATGWANSGWAMQMVALKAGSTSSGSTTQVTATTANLSPASLSFSSLGVGVLSAAQAATLKNTGTASLTISGLAIAGADTGDFVQINTCGSSLASGTSCTIAVIFSPLAVGTRTATLSVSDNTSASPQAITLSGAGSHDVALAWTASSSANVIGYNIYRGTTSGGESSVPLNPTPVNASSYIDVSATAGMKYYYVLAAVSSSGGLSGRSNESSATVPSP
jgi:hypothetical protein